MVAERAGLGEEGGGTFGEEVGFEEARGGGLGEVGGVAVVFGEGLGRVDLAGKRRFEGGGDQRKLIPGFSVRLCVVLQSG